jgi:hypothetical protein
MDIKTILLILAILYALYKAYSVGRSKTKHSGRIASNTPFTSPQLIYQKNPYTEGFKIEGNEVLICKKQLDKVQIHTKSILDKSNEKELKEYHKILRKTNPIYKGTPLYVFSGENEVDLTFDLLYPADYKAILNEIFLSYDTNPSSTVPLADTGKILGFTIGLSTIDGAPIAESKGFVDYYDIPPIDSWFYLKDETLFCWIPNEYLEIMQGAIDVEIFDAYFWLADVNEELNNQLLGNKKTHNSVFKT